MSQKSERRLVRAERARIVDLHPKRPRVGRPTKYRPEFADLVADLCERGSTDAEIAEYLSVSVSTLNLWRATHPEFSAAVRAGKDIADERVARSLFHRAVGYDRIAQKVVIADGEPRVVEYVEHVPPDTAAQVFWLKNRRSFEWRDRHEHVDIRVKAVRSMTTAELMERLAQLDAEEAEQLALPAQGEPATVAGSDDKALSGERE